MGSEGCQVSITAVGNNATAAEKIMEVNLMFSMFGFNNLSKRFYAAIGFSILFLAVISRGLAAPPPPFNSQRDITRNS